MKFVLFKKSLEEGAQPIYLFEGEEEYFKARGEEMLREKFIAEPSLDSAAYDGAEMKGAAMTALVAAAESFPFLSEKRLVKVTDFHPSEKEYNAYLKKYFENPQPSTVLLIVNGVPAKGKGFDLKKAPNVTFVDCGKADEETVMRWIYTRFKREQIYADTEVCERVMRYCLADPQRAVFLLPHAVRDRGAQKERRGNRRRPRNERICREDEPPSGRRVHARAAEKVLQRALRRDRRREKRQTDPRRRSFAGECGYIFRAETK